MGTKYKDSGIPWIGMIPSDWCLLHFKYSGSFEKGKLPNSTNVDGKGFPIIGASEMNGKPPTLFTEQQDIPMCGNEDVLILWDGANAGLVANNLQGIVSSTVVKYSCNDNRCNVQYVYYQYKTLERYFKSKVSGTTIPHMNMKFINGSPMLLPPLPTQQRIADFLDRKCAEIDELAALQETMIAELKRYKQSVITEAVTGKLKIENGKVKGESGNLKVENGKMKDSGVEWIGEIPERWSMSKLKKVAKTNSGSTPKSILNDDTSNIVWIRTTDINEDIVFDSSIHLSHFEMNGCSCPILPKGTCVVAMYGGAGTIGKSGMLGIDATINQALCSLTPEKVDSFFLFYYLQAIRRHWMMFAVGTRKDPNISQEIVKNMPIPIPPLTEQRAIADYLDKKCAEIDELITIKQQKIEALKEYKKSVIFEYVTGKREVER